MSAVLGASVGAGGVRGIVRRSARDQPELGAAATVDTTPAPSGLAPDPWDAILDAVGSLANMYGSEATVLALREENPTDAYGRESADGVVLISELGAQLRALHEAGELGGERTIALLDLGASGVTISVVDSETGQVLLTERSNVLAGDRCDYLLGEYLVTNFGAAEALTGEVRRQLTTDMRDIKEHLTVERSVTLSGPFVDGHATLSRNDLDDVVREDVKQIVDMVAWALDTVRVRVDALVTVGGGANMQTVRQSLFDAFTLPIFAPYEPQLLAARGAASLALETVQPVAAEPEPPARAAPVLPRHSDSARRKKSARRHRGRFLGGILAAGVAGAVAVGIAAAADRKAEELPSAVPSTVVDSSPVSAPRVAGGVPVYLPGTPSSPSVTTEPAPTTVDQAPVPGSIVTTTPTATSGRTPRTTTDAVTTPTGTTPTTTSQRRPDTSAPSTPAPSTPAPSTPAPTTAAPTTTVAPTTKPATTTRSPTTTRTRPTFPSPRN